MIVTNQNIDTCSEADTALTQLIQKQNPSERLAGAVASSSHGAALAGRRIGVIAEK